MKPQPDVQPPRWPLKLLRFFIRKQFLEEVEGDMEEIFADNLDNMSLQRARRLYTWEMLKLLRPNLVKNLDLLKNFNQHAMFKNYFKVSFRGLMKYPLNSAINIIGLSIAIGIAVMVFGFTRWTYSTDQAHQYKNEVFLLTFFANRDGASQQYGTSPRPVGEMLKQDFAAVKKICRIEDRTAVVKYEDNVFNQRIRLADPEFLEVFTFPLKSGSPESLRDINTVIISEDMSQKYFGDDNAVGRTVLIKFGPEPAKAFKVGGVAEKFPTAKTISFQFLVNYQNNKIADPEYDEQDWKKFTNATFIQVDDPKNIESIQNGMLKYKGIQNAAVEKDWALTSFSFEPLATLNRRTEFIRDDISSDSMADNYKSVVFLSFIGTFMLALACFNYINIAIVSAARRLKEIGVRKSIGANRRVVIVQFLTENMVVTMFALLLGVIIGAAGFIPWFEHMNDFSMQFKLNDITLWVYLLAMLIVTGIASGIYPAFYISRFQVVGILKGSVKFGTKNHVTRTLLGIQLVLACIFITAAVLFSQNSTYLAKRSWGYDQRHALYVSVPDQSAFEKMDAIAKQNSGVLSVSGSQNHLGKQSATVILQLPDREYEADRVGIAANYFKTMGLHIVNGRDFNDHEGSDKQSVIVNELMVKNMVWENPIGQQFRIDTTQYEVVGVVKDFHSYSFYYPMKPTIFTIADKSEFRFITMRVREESEKQTLKDVQTQWAKLYPEIPFDGGYQEDIWGYYFDELDVHGEVWRVFALIAVALAGMGLYGLITLNVAGRTREFSIRKVLGAGLKNIAGNVAGQYVGLFIIALGIGAPISYIIVKTVFDAAYRYHIPITYEGVAIAVAILIIVLIATVSTQVRKVLKSNPVSGLKTE